MSVVSGITLHIDFGACERESLEEIQSWLAQRNLCPMTQLDQYYGGSKHPQIRLFGAGYNFFPEEEFAELVCSLNWECPGNVILIINPEEGSARVYQPKKGLL